MPWEQIQPNDSSGIAEFIGLMRPIHASYSDMDEAAVLKIVSSNQDCEVWVERHAQMAMVLRNHQPTGKGHVLMMAMPDTMDNDTGLKYVCQIFSDYSSRHGSKDIIAIVPKTGCLPRMASFYLYATTTIPGSNLVKESIGAVYSALPKYGCDILKIDVAEIK